MNKSLRPAKLNGTILIPASKSDGQRALLAAALGKGETRINNAGISHDELAMRRNIERLGAEIEVLNDHEILVRGIGNFPSSIELNAGESGLGVRLITSVCAAHKGEFNITGEGSLLERPQGFFEDHLVQLGVGVKSTNGCLPIRVTGPMQGGRINVDGSMSSQFLSGLLMALPLVENDTVLDVHNLKSIPYVDMTLDTLKRFGLSIENDNYEQFTIRGNQSYECEHYQVESDWSSASYWLVAAALGHEVRVLGLSMVSHQADKALIDALVASDCVVNIHDGIIEIDGSSRGPVHFDATHCPDLFPALVTYATLTEGTSRILGVDRLAVKESDRGKVLKEEFEKLGAKITLDGNEMIVEGGRPLRAAHTSAHNDHRIAMCLGIASTLIEGELTIEEAESVAKSYPQFWDHLASLSQ